MIPHGSIDSLIVHLRDLSATERSAYLEQACINNPDLNVHRAEIAHLLAANGPPSAASQPTIASLDAARRMFDCALETTDRETEGTRIGPYKLLQKIGEGGFGVVWMADQEEPIRRRVALKIIKAGMDTKEVIARFEAERQALALMDHSNIARVFDAGATESGRPFFVMELVRGVPITRYCDENCLPAETRLRLFISVCQAVQHAHQKGVIHRDLKPSNILVTLHDGAPMPKVIDFGIAKATSGARLTDKTLFTQFHVFIGTPAYTSPEQMEMSGLDVDTRSDIYSLGVLLYELLTGQPPFDPDALAKSGLEAMRRTIREIDPPRPSHCLNTLTDEDRTTVAHRRGTDAARLSLLLRGDLDWIVMRCLEKDRSRRYETANGLATDVERHLRDDPVQARPPSRIYQAKKFIRRHKLAVSAGAAVAATLIAGLIVSSALFVRERSAHGRATVAEKKEGELRQQAETARVDEVKRAARTALNLANRNLSDGRVPEGLAYLVYAARKDPKNATLASRLASVLALHNFLLPQGGEVFECGSRVLATRFTKDGKSIFVGTEDGVFRVVDAFSGKLTREFRFGGRVSLGGWEFARDNENVVGVRFVDNTFGVYETASGRPKITPLQLDPRVGTYPEYLGLAHSLGVSPDGRWIFASAFNEFWVWDAATGKAQLNSKLTGEISGSDISADGGRIAVASGRSVHQWSLPEGAPLGAAMEFGQASRLGGPALRINVQFSRDGRFLAVCNSTEGIHLLDAATGARLSILAKVDDYLVASSLAFTARDRIFASGNRVSGSWDLNTGKFMAAPIPAGDKLLNVYFDGAGGRGLAMSDDGFIRVFDLASGTLVAEPTWQQRSDFCAALSPDGTQAAIGTTTGAVLRLSIGRGRSRPLALPRSLRPPMPAPFFPDAPARLLWMLGDRALVIDVASGREVAGGFRYPDSILATNSFDYNPPVRSDLKFMVVRVRSGEWQSWELGAGGITHVAALKDVPAGGGVIAFSSSGDLVAITSADVLRVWNLRTGEAIGVPFTHPTGIVFLTPNFSPDGKHLALGIPDGSALIVDIATGHPITTFPTRALVPNRAVQISPDGTRLLTANIRSEIRLWNSLTGGPVSPLFPVMGTSGQGRFSADGRWLITWGESVTSLRDGTTGVAIGQPIPAGGKHVRFSADGGRIATAERAGNAQVWDVPGGEAATEPMPHQPFPAMLPEFSPDGRFLKTENSSFYLWSLPPQASKDPTPAEWLLQLATLCASKIVDDAGDLVDATNAIANIDHLRQQIAELPFDAPFADWGRWILDDRADRPIAPGFTVTPVEAEALKTRLAKAAEQ